jgi:mannose-1-phosphate guanylyltransferase
MVVTGASHAVGVARQLPQISADQIVVEPSPRDSAPAIGLAATLIHRRSPDAIMGSFAADHRVTDGGAFLAAVRTAIAVAANGKLVTIGLTPTHPETGYGYIHQAEALPGGGSRVAAFKEKPSAEVAAEYVTSGEYLWNASMFVWRVETLLGEIRRQVPELAEGLERIADAWESPSRDEVLAAIWPTLPKISIDYAVMEGAAAAGLVVTVPADIGWNDVGDWDTLGSILQPDAQGNTVIATGENQVYTVDSGDCVVVPHGGRAVALLGLRDVIVVDTADALLVAARDRAQDVKKLVDQLPVGDPLR